MRPIRLVTKVLSVTVALLTFGFATAQDFESIVVQRSADPVPSSEINLDEPMIEGDTSESPSDTQSLPVYESAFGGPEACGVCNCPGDSCQCGGQARLECAPGQTLFWNGVHRNFVDRCFSGAHPTASPARWYAIGELVPLFRDQDDSNWQTLGPSGPGVLDTHDFATEFDAGARLTLGRALGQSWRIEGVYLGNYDWTGDQTVRNTDINDQAGVGNLQSPFSNFGNPTVQGVDYNRFASIRSDATMYSLELNLRRRILMDSRKFHHAEVSFLVGGRYMQIDESFGYHTESNLPAGGSINDIGVTTDNNLIGFQIGLLSQFMVRERIWVDFDVKGAVFHNEASMNSNYVNTQTDGTLIASLNTGTELEPTSFMGDLSLTANYQFAPAMTFKIGYNAIWMSGIAVASENLNRDLSIVSLGPPTLDHSGDVVYHGPSAGFVWAY